MSLLWSSEDGVTFISGSRALLDFSQLRDFLNRQSRWKGVTKEIWDEVLAASTDVLGVYQQQGESSQLNQVGFARTVSDCSRFTWLGDFFILPSHRGIGLGKVLLDVLLTSAAFQVRRQMVDVQGCIELESLLQKYGGFNLVTVPDSMNASTMYKLVPNGLARSGQDSHYTESTKEKVFHPTLGGYFASTGPELFQPSVIHGFLQNSYWSRGITKGVVELEMGYSDCIALFYEPIGEAQGIVKPEQVGFARWITDRSTFAYLSDVFVIEQHAGKGLGKWLIQQAQEMPAVKSTLPTSHLEAGPDIFPRLLALRTSTAQDLYHRHAGFREIQGGEDHPVRIMMRITKSIEQRIEM